MSTTEQEQQEQQEQGLPSIDESLGPETEIAEEEHDEQVQAITKSSKKAKRGLVLMLVCALGVIGGGIFGVFHVINGFNDTEALVIEPETTLRDTPVAMTSAVNAVDKTPKANELALYEVSPAENPTQEPVSLPVSTESESTFEVKEPSFGSQQAPKESAPEKDTSINKSELSELLNVLNAQNQLLNKIVEGQQTILSQVNKNGKLANDQIDASEAIGVGLQGVVKGNEAIVRLVTEVGKAATSSQERATRRTSHSIKKTEDEPQFATKSASLWGDEVKVLIELKGGFYKNVQLGDEVDGWKLLDIDLKKKQTTWGKGNVEQVHKYS